MNTLSWNQKLEHAFEHPDEGDFGDDNYPSSRVLALIKITIEHPEETSKRIFLVLQKLDDDFENLEITQEMGLQILGDCVKCFARHGSTLRKEVLEAEKSYRCISPKLDEIAQGKIPVLSCDALSFLGKLPSRFWTVEDYNKALLQDTALQNALTSYPADSDVVKMRAEGLIDTLRQAEGNGLVLLPYLEKLASGGGHGKA